MSAWMFACALIGTIYGIAHFFMKKSALYLKMITCGVGCAMFSGLFVVVYRITLGGLPEGFHIGCLGIVGSFLFLLSANYGQMDTLVDDGSENFKKTRRIAAIVPLILAAFYIFLILREKAFGSRLSLGFVAIILIPCAYYNFKHIIIFDVEMGLIRQIRAYNILALCYAFFTTFKYLTEYMEIMWLYVVSCMGVGIVSVCLLPALSRGYDRWIREA